MRRRLPCATPPFGTQGVNRFAEGAPVVALLVIVAVAAAAALLIATAVFGPRTRWWQAYQNRVHDRRPGPGGPRFL